MMLQDERPVERQTENHGVVRFIERRAHPVKERRTARFLKRERFLKDPCEIGHAVHHLRDMARVLRAKLRAVGPVRLEAVVFLRIVARRHHHTADTLVMAYRK